MNATNLGEGDGLPPIEWSRVEPQLADLLTHDHPRSPNRSTFWLGPPPWFVYEVKPRTVTAVGTAEATPGSMRWRF